MKLRFITERINEMTERQVKSFAVGLMGVCAASEETYSRVEGDVPIARILSNEHNGRFNDDIKFACDLLEAETEDQISQIISRNSATVS